MALSTGQNRVRTAVFISGTGSNLKSLVIFSKSKNLKKINKFFSKEYKPYVIGKIFNGKNKVKLNGSINWSQ